MVPQRVPRVRCSPPMWRATLRGLLDRRLRLVFTVAAVVVGVGFVTGSLVLTDTLGARLDELFLEAGEGIDVTVRSGAGYGTGPGLAADRARLDASLLETVRRVEGVEAAEGTLIGLAQLVAPDGEAIPPRLGPGLGFSWPEREDLALLRLREGRRPEGPREMAIDAGTARAYDFAPGDRVRVLLDGPAEEFRLAGTFTFGDEANPGPTLAAFDTATAQRAFGAPGQLDTINVAASPGVTPETLRERVAKALPAGVEAVTGEQAAADNADTLRASLEFLTAVLLVFAAVGVLVGAFLIANTFSILVGQRTRELGLLRAVGAGRGQVIRSVLAEAATVGAMSSALGLVFGVLIADGVLRAVERYGVNLPGGRPEVLARTALVAVAVGVVVTVGAAAVPAWRASRVTPVVALREAPSAPGRPSRRRAFAGSALLAAGAGITVMGLAGNGMGALRSVGIGGLAVVGALGVLGPFAVAPLSRVVGGLPARWGGVAGRLALKNARRSPRRTASTAAALMIGVGLMTMVAVLADSARASVSDAVGDGLRADYVLSADELFPFSAQVASRMSALPEVRVAAELRLGNAVVDGSGARVAAIEPAAFADAADLGAREGTVSHFGPGDVLVHHGVAADRGWSVGDTIDLGLPRTGLQRVRIAGIFTRNQLTFASYVLPMATYEAGYGAQQDSFVFVRLAEGIADRDGLAAIDGVLADFPNVDVHDRDGFASAIGAQVDRVLVVIDALLALAVLTGLLGVSNTLALAVVERTRELGLLRAIGMSRRQVASMVAWESVVVTVIGACLGVASGLVLGLVVVTALRDLGVTTFAVPFATLGILVAGAAVAGSFASVLPARRAARLDVLEAVAME